jgi:hypothetical protein
MDRAHQALHGTMPARRDGAASNKAVQNEHDYDLFGASTRSFQQPWNKEERHDVIRSSSA